MSSTIEARPGLIGSLMRFLPFHMGQQPESNRHARSKQIPLEALFEKLGKLSSEEEKNLSSETKSHVLNISQFVQEDLSVLHPKARLGVIAVDESPGLAAGEQEIYLVILASSKKYRDRKPNISAQLFRATRSYLKSQKESDEPTQGHPSRVSSFGRDTISVAYPDGVSFNLSFGNASTPDLDQWIASKGLDPEAKEFAVVWRGRYPPSPKAHSQEAV